MNSETPDMKKEPMVQITNFFVKKAHARGATFLSKDIGYFKVGQTPVFLSRESVGRFIFKVNDVNFPANQTEVYSEDGGVYFFNTIYGQRFVVGKLNTIPEIVITSKKRKDFTNSLLSDFSTLKTFLENKESVSFKVLTNTKDSFGFILNGQTYKVFSEPDATLVNNGFFTFPVDHIQVNDEEIVFVYKKMHKSIVELDITK
jgi:hypothetical protein